MTEAIEVYQALRSAPGLLESVSGSNQDSLKLQQSLRKEYPVELVRAAISLSQLRQKAGGRFSEPLKLWTDRVGLEQASPEVVADYKAERYRQLNSDEPVWDLCCGIGGDAAALARHFRVIAVDRDPLHCLFTRWNCERLGRADSVQVICSDVRRLLLHDKIVHLDPDRRAGQKGRARRLESYEPDLPFLQQLTDSGKGGGIKLGPAANFTGKFPGAEIELISLNGECKEATVWYGDLAADGEVRRATVLPAGESIAADPLSSWPEQSELGRYLYDPDPAVVRSNLVDVASERLGLSRLDAEEEYLTSLTLVDSPFVRAFEVIQDLPNNDKTIRQFFRQNEFGDVEIKCRHVPIQADAVRRKLSLKSGPRATLIYARIDGRVRAIVARRI